MVHPEIEKFWATQEAAKTNTIRIPKRHAKKQISQQISLERWRRMWKIIQITDFQWQKKGSQHALNKVKVTIRLQSQLFWTKPAVFTSATSLNLGSDGPHGRKHTSAITQKPAPKQRINIAWANLQWIEKTRRCICTALKDFKAQSPWRTSFVVICVQADQVLYEKSVCPRRWNCARRDHCVKECHSTLSTLPFAEWNWKRSTTGSSWQQSREFDTFDTFDTPNIWHYDRSGAAQVASSNVKALPSDHASYNCSTCWFQGSWNCIGFEPSEWNFSDRHKPRTWIAQHSVVPVRLAGTAALRWHKQPGNLTNSSSQNYRRNAF